MAYVKKSDSLFDDIKNKIRFMFQSQRTHAERWDNYGLSLEEMDNKIWNSIMPTDTWDKITELSQLMPGAFTEQPRLIVKISANPNVIHSNYVQYVLQFAQNRPIPYKWISHFNNAVDTSPVCTDPDIVRISLERKAKCLRVEEATAEFMKQVKEAWEAVSSVNAFVKAWPPGRDLLPAATIEKLNEKVERTKPVVSIDTTALNTELLKAKIVA